MSTTNPTLAMVLSVLRAFGAMIGGYIIGKGYVTADQASQLGGAALVIITAAFGIYSQYRNKRAVAVALATPVPVASAVAQ